MHFQSCLVSVLFAILAHAVAPSAGFSDLYTASLTFGLPSGQLVSGSTGPSPCERGLYAAASQASPSIAELYGAQATVGAQIARSDAEYGAQAGITSPVFSTKELVIREILDPTPASDPTNVFIDAPTNSVNLVYRSTSSTVQVENHHQGQPGVFKETSSVDGPHRTVHTVHKPVIQELREIISPIRKVQQQVLPVQEEIQSIISKAVRSPHHHLQAHGGAPFGHGLLQEQSALFQKHPQGHFFRPQSLAPGPHRHQRHLEVAPPHGAHHGLAAARGGASSSSKQQQRPLQHLQDVLRDGLFRHITGHVIEEVREAAEEAEEGPKSRRIPGRNSLYSKMLAAAGAA